MEAATGGLDPVLKTWDRYCLALRELSWKCLQEAVNQQQREARPRSG